MLPQTSIPAAASDVLGGRVVVFQMRMTHTFLY
jgi:hypothetical protein